MEVEKQIVHIQYYSSPCGELILASMDNKLCLCDWNQMPTAQRNQQRLAKGVNALFRMETSSVLQQTKEQLDAYFAGKRKTFDVALHPIGTDFQLQVWKALRNIPYGETMSYQDIALSIGKPKACRAVAKAIGANGISILITCHRVIGSNHALTGFAGGLAAKSFLLRLEHTH